MYLRKMLFAAGCAFALMSISGCGGADSGGSTESNAVIADTPDANAESDGGSGSTSCSEATARRLDENMAGYLCDVLNYYPGVFPSPDAILLSAGAGGVCGYLASESGEPAKSIDRTITSLGESTDTEFFTLQQRTAIVDASSKNFCPDDGPEARETYQGNQIRIPR